MARPPARLLARLLALLWLWRGAAACTATVVRLGDHDYRKVRTFYEVDMDVKKKGLDIEGNLMIVKNYELAFVITDAQQIRYIIPRYPSDYFKVQEVMPNGHIGSARSYSALYQQTPLDHLMYAYSNKENVLYKLQAMEQSRGLVKMWTEQKVGVVDLRQFVYINGTEFMFYTDQNNALHVTNFHDRARISLRRTVYSLGYQKPRYFFFDGIKLDYLHEKSLERLPRTIVRFPVFLNVRSIIFADELDIYLCNEKGVVRVKINKDMKQHTLSYYRNFSDCKVLMFHHKNAIIFEGRMGYTLVRYPVPWGKPVPLLQQRGRPGELPTRRPKPPRGPRPASDPGSPAATSAPLPPAPLPRVRTIRTRRPRSRSTATSSTAAAAVTPEPPEETAPNERPRQRPKLRPSGRPRERPSAPALEPLERRKKTTTTTTTTTHEIPDEDAAFLHARDGLSDGNTPLIIIGLFMAVVTFLGFVAFVACSLQARRFNVPYWCPKVWQK